MRKEQVKELLDMLISTFTNTDLTPAQESLYDDIRKMIDQLEEPKRL